MKDKLHATKMDIVFQVGNLIVLFSVWGGLR